MDGKISLFFVSLRGCFQSCNLHNLVLMKDTPSTAVSQLQQEPMRDHSRKLIEHLVEITVSITTMGVCVFI